MAEKKRPSCNWKIEENTLKQITRSLEEIKQLLNKVIETSNKEPTVAATVEKSLEEMKELLWKVIAVQPSGAVKPVGEATSEKSLEEIKQLLLKVIANQTSSKELPATAESSNARTSLSTMDSEDEYSLAKCMKMIERLDLNWPTGSFYHVSELLQEKGKREMFMSMSYDQRCDWMKDVKSQIRK